MRVLRPVIFPQSASHLDVVNSKTPGRTPAGSEPVGDDPFGELFVGQEQLGEESHSGEDIAIWPHDLVKELVFAIDCPPQIHALAIDRANHFIEVPARGGRWPFRFDVFGNLRTEPDRPAPDRLVTDVDASFGQQFLDIAQAQGEAKIEPDCVANDVRWKSVTFERQFAGLGARLHRRADARIRRQVAVRLTAPL